MVGLFLITHGAYGEALVQNVIHILNKRPPHLVALGLASQDDPLELLPTARQMLSEVDQGQGVLLMTDVYGASPANLAMKLLEPGHVEGVAGLSLPMLLRALTYREKDMETLLSRSISGACEGVMQMHLSDRHIKAEQATA